MPSLTKRKTFKIGQSQAITLPKAWLEYFGIKPGDRMEIIANGDLTIRRAAEPDEMKP